jgi:hypothetical protein
VHRPLEKVQQEMGKESWMEMQSRWAGDSDSELGFTYGV